MKVADEEQSDEHKQVPVEPLALEDDNNCEVDVEQSIAEVAIQRWPVAHTTASILNDFTRGFSSNKAAR